MAPISASTDRTHEPTAELIFFSNFSGLSWRADSGTSDYGARMRLAFIALVALAGCTPAKYAPTFAPIDSDGRALRDSEGRIKLYRGVNVHIAGIFDVTFADGRAPREPLPAFDASDPIDMRARGFNLVRLPINWSAIEPARGQYDEAYLDRVAQVVAWCRDAGVDVLVDLHQDGWSKELCEDGAPLWAIVPPPATLTGGPVPGPDCHATGPALTAFDSFWADTDGLGEAYLAMLAHVAGRFRDDPAVIGYEIMNEPIGVDDTVQTFQKRAAQTLRDNDTKKLVVFEPSATRNFTNSSPIASAPFPVGGAVYAVHIYTSVFGTNPTLADGTFPPLLAASFSAARDEAAAWATPLMVTEFGLGSTAPNSYEWIGDALDGADSNFASTAWWLWKDPTPDPNTWGLFQANADGSYTARAQMFASLARPYAQAVGGDPVSTNWDGATLTVSFRARGGVPAVHDIFWSGAAPTIACDGNPVSAMAVANSVYSVACSGSTLTFR
jgi:endoglycosylceramidase